MKERDNVLLALFIAIIGIMTFVPFLGYITTGGISITTIHIPLIIGAIALGKTRGAVIGLAFGLFNLIKAYTSGTPEALIFMDPMISVLPRVLAGYFIGLFFEFINNFENKKGESATRKLYYLISIISIALVSLLFGIIGFCVSVLIAVVIYFILEKYSSKFKLSVILTSITGTLIHTVLVLTAIGVFAGSSLLSVGENIIAIFQIVVLLNVVFEILIAVVITPVIVTGLSKGRFIEI